MSRFNLKSKLWLVKTRERDRETKKKKKCLIFKHCLWITVFSLQICTAFKGIMSISCLFFPLLLPQQEAPGALWVDGSQENTQGKKK